MNIDILTNQLLILFIIMAMGYLMFKFNTLDANFNQKCSKLIVNLTMPCMIINSVLTLSSRPAGKDVMTVAFVGLSMYIILPIIGFIISKLTRTSRNQVGIYTFMYTFSNVGFMGFPVLNAVYGPLAVFYAGIINIIFNIACYSYGIFLINMGHKGKGSMSIKKLFSPGILCSLLAVAIYVYDFRLPSVVASAIESVGGLTSTLSMLVIGSTLARLKLSELFGGGRIYMFSFIKQLILPLLFLPICKYFLTNDLIFGVTMILLLMPVANSAVLFANDFGHDEKLAAKTVFVSTLLSMLTIPLIMGFAI